MANVLGRPKPAAPRGPVPSLSGILGAGARRREDIGTARFGSAAQIRPPSSDAKILRPSDSRAAGRTTNLSSIPSAARGSRAVAPANSPGLSRRKPGGPAGDADGSKVVAGSGKGGRSGGGGGGGCGSGSGSGDGGSGGSRSGGSRRSSSSPAGDGEDLLGLPWAYGSGDSGSGGGGGSDGGGSEGGGGSNGGGSKHSAKGALEPKAGLGKGRAHESMKRGASGNRGGGGGDGGSGGGGGGEGGGGDAKVALAAKPPRQAHPAGYMDGTVAVPAQSSVFLTMPQRCAVRADGSRTIESAKKVADLQVRFCVR